MIHIVKLAKQPNKVKGNIDKCINFQMCPICYGCRNHDLRVHECQECWEDGIRQGENRNYNVCNTKLHESWKVNQMTTKNIIKLNEETTINNGKENE